MWPQEENGSPVAFTKDGKSVYVQSSLGYDTTRLLQVRLPFVTLSTVTTGCSRRYGPSPLSPFKVV